MFYLSPEQSEAVAPVVRGRKVLDLGARDLQGTKAMLELGAAEVWAVDRNEMPRVSDPRVRTEINFFHNLQESREVVLASWVVNWPVGIEHLLAEAKFIVSLSKNTDGSACGYQQMWEYLSTREVLVYLPEFKNTLTIYGPGWDTERSLTGEEFAALNPQTMFSFFEAESQASGRVGV